jgi:hypothetical protein
MKKYHITISNMLGQCEFYCILAVSKNEALRTFVKESLGFVLLTDTEKWTIKIETINN